MIETIINEYTNKYKENLLIERTINGKSSSLIEVSNKVDDEIEMLFILKEKKENLKTNYEISLFEGSKIKKFSFEFDVNFSIKEFLEKIEELNKIFKKKTSIKDYVSEDNLKEFIKLKDNEKFKYFIKLNETPILLKKIDNLSQTNKDFFENYNGENFKELNSSLNIKSEEDFNELIKKNINVFKKNFNSKEKKEFISMIENFNFYKETKELLCGFVDYDLDLLKKIMKKESDVIKILIENNKFDLIKTLIKESTNNTELLKNLLKNSILTNNIKLLEIFNNNDYLFVVPFNGEHSDNYNIISFTNKETTPEVFEFIIDNLDEKTAIKLNSDLLTKFISDYISTGKSNLEHITKFVNKIEKNDYIKFIKPKIILASNKAKNKEEIFKGLLDNVKDVDYTDSFFRGFAGHYENDALLMKEILLNKNTLLNFPYESLVNNILSSKLLNPNSFTDIKSLLKEEYNQDNKVYIKFEKINESSKSIDEGIKYNPGIIDREHFYSQREVEAHETKSLEEFKKKYSVGKKINDFSLFLALQNRHYKSAEFFLSDKNFDVNRRIYQFIEESVRGNNLEILKKIIQHPSFDKKSLESHEKYNVFLNNEVSLELIKYLVEELDCKFSISSIKYSPLDIDKVKFLLEAKSFNVLELTDSFFKDNNTNDRGYNEKNVKDSKDLIIPLHQEKIKEISLNVIKSIEELGKIKTKNKSIQI